jgi:hypothetical protein
MAAAAAALLLIRHSSLQGAVLHRAIAWRQQLLASGSWRLACSLPKQDECTAAGPRQMRLVVYSQCTTRWQTSKRAHIHLGLFLPNQVVDHPMFMLDEHIYQQGAVPQQLGTCAVLPMLLKAVADRNATC